MICFHHNDGDGYCSLYIVKRKFPEIEGFPIDYSKPFPYDKITPGELVVVVDYSFDSLENLNKLLAITENVIWIDHHVSSLKLGKVNVKGVRGENVPAACYLCWQYFFPKESMPEVVELVSDYDTWQFKFGDPTKFFAKGLMLYQGEEDIWEDLLNDVGGDLIARITEEGKIIMKYQSIYYHILLKNASFETVFEGHHAVVCNSCKLNMELFKHAPKRNLKIVFYFDGDHYNVTLYSETIDCEKIARKYGGGGHFGAAGFKVKELPFKKI
jgi:oligoribonuclease NrnB/cAMP/cGMP phosphodiesterase (DHH superfamily)